MLYNGGVKCDMHVHSIHSGMFTHAVLDRFCRECYSAPEEVYATLKRRGMDLVTLTDHDSIEAAESLRHHPDFFLSEEVTCRMPSGTEVHIGVYDITEGQHLEIQRRRNDLVSLLMYLTERRLFFSVNHVFSSLTGRRVADDFKWFESYFPAYETRNGQMLPQQNEHAAGLARRLGKAQVGGSDAHSLASAGTAFTEVFGARGRQDFLEAVRRGHARASGSSGNYWKLTRDVYVTCAGMMRERPWTALLAPLAALIPAATLGHYWREAAFSRRWGHLADANPPPVRREPLWQPARASREVLA